MSRIGDSGYLIPGGEMTNSSPLSTSIIGSLFSSSSATTSPKSTVSETINKIKGEKFDQLNFLRIKNLVKSI